MQVSKRFQKSLLPGETTVTTPLRLGSDTGVTGVAMVTPLVKDEPGGSFTTPLSSLDLASMLTCMRIIEDETKLQSKNKDFIKHVLKLNEVLHLYTWLTIQKKTLEWRKKNGSKWFVKNNVLYDLFKGNIPVSLIPISLHSLLLSFTAMVNACYCTSFWIHKCIPHFC